MHCFCRGYCNLLALLVQLTCISRVASHSICFWVVCEEYACLQRHLHLVTSKSWWMEPELLSICLKAPHAEGEQVLSSLQWCCNDFWNKPWYEAASASDLIVGEPRVWVSYCMNEAGQAWFIPEARWGERHSAHFLCILFVPANAVIPKALGNRGAAHQDSKCWEERRCRKAKIRRSLVSKHLPLCSTILCTCS